METNLVGYQQIINKIHYNLSYGTFPLKLNIFLKYYNSLVKERYMSQNCYDLSCSQKCCNYYGYCPTSSGDVQQSSCYYYYSDYSNTILGIIFSIIPISVCIAIAIVVCCVVHKARKTRQNERIARQQYELNNNSRPSQMIIIQNPNEPAYGQSAYNLNSNQNGYIQNPPAAQDNNPQP